MSEIKELPGRGRLEFEAFPSGLIAIRQYADNGDHAEILLLPSDVPRVAAWLQELATQADQPRPAA